MSPEAFHAAALALKAATVDVKWGADRCYSAGGKMFAVLALDDDGKALPRYAFKCTDGSFEQLIAEGVAEPAPYMARAKWVHVVRDGALSDEEIVRYLAIAHGLIAAKLTRKARAELGLA